VGVGGAAGTPGGGSAGAGGGTAGGGAGSAGSGGTPPGTPTSVTVTTTDVSVSDMGVVFNVADNYFRGGFNPATPVANFGLHSQIIPVANADGSLDVAWLDYTNGDERPWAVTSPGTIYITHIDAAFTGATTESTGVSSYKLLGFAKDGAGAFYVAFNEDHAMKSTNGDENELDGNELHVIKRSGGATQWDELVFGDGNNNLEDVKGDPAGAASSVLGYDPTNDRLVLYLGHSMMWDDGVRHQGGFFRLLNPATGDVVQPGGSDVIHFGAGWWYSHNFNQRLLIHDGDYYVLAHGDAYSRQLGFARWSLEGYMNEDGNETDFDEPYWDIAGSTGDNNTNAQTGQFVRLSDGRFLIVHTTSEGRSARDVRLVFADGSAGTADADGAVWLTTNAGGTHATMPKVELLGDYVLVTYALWPGGETLNWYAALLDTSLQTVVAPAAVSGAEFVDSAPLFRFAGGLNAGKVGWVSGNAAHTLNVSVADLGYQ
jgi:hypothetical protein